MTVGIPGTGLGGLFYFLLVILMPFRELYLTVRGRSSVARWRRVAFQLSILAAMLAVLWGEAWALEKAFAAFQAGERTDASPARELFLKTGQVAAVTSVCVLAVLLAVVAALGLTPLAQRLPGDEAKGGRPMRIGAGAFHL